MLLILKNLMRRFFFRLGGRMIRLKSRGPSRGNVLISYTTLPFVFPETIDGHSNRWECKQMAETFTEFGFNVDVVDAANKSFIPRKKYDYCIDITNNLAQFKLFLNSSCIKIFHITATHWLFQNTAEYKRLLNIKERRGVVLTPKRIVEPSYNIEYADVVTILGNDFTVSTYQYAGKKICRIPISTTHTFPSPENKDFEKIKKNFVWIGGSGMAHKGLDLVLEAFSDLPDFNLSILGKLDPDFGEAYKKELFNAPNIKYTGWLNPGSNEFKNTINNSLGLIYPSSSEGQAGSVILSMHAGLIPIISYESGVNVENFGIILKENSIEEIKKQARFIVSLSKEELKERAINAWKYANKNHTRENFSKKYKEFVTKLLNKEV